MLNARKLLSVFRGFKSCFLWWFLQSKQRCSLQISEKYFASLVSPSSLQGTHLCWRISSELARTNLVPLTDAIVEDLKISNGITITDTNL